MNPGNRSSERSFGRRDAGAQSPTAPTASRKRSAFIAIGALGAGALGLMALSNPSNCNSGTGVQDPAKDAQKCDSRSSGRHWFGSGTGWGSTKTNAATPAVERGGFGRTASSFFSRIGG